MVYGLRSKVGKRGSQFWVCYSPDLVILDFFDRVVFHLHAHGHVVAVNEAGEEAGGDGGMVDG